MGELNVRPWKPCADESATACNGRELEARSTPDRSTPPAQVSAEAHGRPRPNRCLFFCPAPTWRHERSADVRYQGGRVSSEGAGPFATCRLWRAASRSEGNRSCDGNDRSPARPGERGEDG